MPSIFLRILFAFLHSLYPFSSKIGLALRKLSRGYGKAVWGFDFAAISGCPSHGFSTAFSIRPPYKFPARVSAAPSYCFSPCSSLFSDASSALDGRCPSFLAFQCFSSTSVLSSLLSPSSMAGLSVDSSYRTAKSNQPDSCWTKKPYEVTMACAKQVDGCLCYTLSSLSTQTPVHDSLTIMW